jgi:hypothetical protein
MKISSARAVSPNTCAQVVVTENSVRFENTGVPIIREIMVATMSSLFVAFFTLIASTFRTRAALQEEILVTNLRYSKRTRCVACASTAATALVGCVVPILVRLAAIVPTENSVQPMADVIPPNKSKT